MDAIDVIRSQYHAALEMLKQSIEKCPEALWNDPQEPSKFGQVAYHALFYTHLYLQKSISDFHPWEKHREGAEALGPRPETASGQAEPLQVYSQAEVLEYLAVCRQQVDAQVAQLDLEGESGFYWLSMNRLELQFYNIRHLQQHTGELMERLGARAGVEVDWVGMKRE